MTAVATTVADVFQDAKTTISFDQLRDLLVNRTIDGKSGNAFTVCYVTDMLKKGKLRASAQSAFPCGLFHEVRTLVNVNYDYDKKMEARGDEASGKGNWQMAILINGRVSPLTTHKDDVVSFDGQTVVVKSGGRAYLRYEPATPAQQEHGFCKGNYSRYKDGKGREVDYRLVGPFFFDRQEQTVNHRTLNLGGVTEIKIDGKTYVIAN